MTHGSEDLAVVVVAAGRSERYGARNKLLARLGSATVLEHSVAPFVGRPDVGQIVVVVSPPDAPTFEQRLAPLVESGVPIEFAAGGEKRRQSVCAGVAKVRREAEFIAIHDAARPLVDCDLIDRVAVAAREHGAAIPVIPVTDTVFHIRNGVIEGTVPRDHLRAAQTPQIFKASWLRRALDESDEGTDEASALYECGYPVHLVDGSADNLKITWPRDVRLAAALLKAPTA